MTLREHIGSHTSALIRRVVSQVRQTVERDDEESIHDLRVSLRRLRECLRTFQDLYPPSPRKKLRKHLRRLMKRAELVRSSDVDLDLLLKAGLTESAPRIRRIREQRIQQVAALREQLTLFLGCPDLKTWAEALRK